ncbi:MAG: class I SAM-dependent methyltransferase [Streptosporangiaceae bacterium]
MPVRWPHACQTAQPATRPRQPWPPAPPAPADSRVVRHRRRTLRPHPAGLSGSPGGGDHRRQPGPDVLDVGCGTGIEARQFQAAGCTVLGVEPDTRMAEFARRSGIEAKVATFECLGRRRPPLRRGHR